jgi:hypothetical protein
VNRWTWSAERLNPARSLRTPKVVQGGSATRRPKDAAPLVVLVDRDQLGLQETVGQVQVPLAWMVAPQLLPLPLDLATSCWALG